MKKNLFAVLTAGLLTACTQENAWEPALQANDHITVNAQIQGFVPAAETRTVINTTDYSCTWKTGDEIGMFSNHIDGETQTPSQLGLSLYTGNGTGEAIFTGSTGWKMNPNGEYNYVAYYPYGDRNTRESIMLDYTGQTQTANNSTTHLGDYDFMYSNATMPTNADGIAISFSHINTITNLKMILPEAYKDRLFRKVCLIANEDIFTSQATYDMQSLIEDGKPTITPTQTTNMIELEFGEEGISATNGVLDAWLMMMPTQWNGKEITVKLYDIFSAIPLLERKFTPTADQQASMIYSYYVTLSKSEQLLPNKPREGEQLHILLFGHSFGVDCTEYLPAITKAAGITDVHLGRFYQGGCPMKEHWRHWTEEDTYAYYNSVAGSGTWAPYTYRSSKSVVAEYPWDIIIFQCGTTSSQEGNYNNFNEPLRNMVDEVVAMCKQKHNKTPLIGWNMFWGFNIPLKDYGKSSKDYSATKEYYKIVNAAKEMLADNTDVHFVIPTGTAVQNVRGTSLHDSSCMRQLTRDGEHIGYGFGRYVTACTWFQTLIAPIYGIDVEASSSYLPTGTDTYTDYGNGVTDKVTTENRPILWKCAKAAVLHPFEVTTIEE